MGLGRARPLTEMGLRVLRLSASGMTAEEVAEHLDLDLAQVQRHLREAIVAVGARSKLEAVVIALRQGLIDPPRE